MLRFLFIALCVLAAGCSVRPVLPAMALSEYQARVADLVRDPDSRITAAQRDGALADAARQYSEVRPLTYREDVYGGGNRDLVMPDFWVADASELISIEYPVGDKPPSMLETDEYYIYVHPSSAQHIIMPVAVPRGTWARVTYHRPHWLNAETDTIPERDAAAISWYAAAILCDQLAAVYAGSGDATIQADSVEHESKTQHYLRLAKEYRQLYATHLGVPVPGRRGAGAGGASPVRPAGAVAQISDDRRWLTHDDDGLLSPDRRR